MNDCLGRKVITDSFFLMPVKAEVKFFYYLFSAGFQFFEG